MEMLLALSMIAMDSNGVHLLALPPMGDFSSAVMTFDAVLAISLIVVIIGTCAEHLVMRKKRARAFLRSSLARSNQPSKQPRPKSPPLNRAA